ncbi:hypothetical protein MRB53_041402 [Persea americana]|nr:hypothetical protein MRB53_041402 [Persea americana]
MRPANTQRPPPTRHRKLRLERSKKHKVAFELKGVAADLFVYPDGEETQMSADVRVNEFEIFDHVPTSTWKKFVTYMHESGPREDKKAMLHLEICNVKPVLDLTASELVIRDALDFITRFFGFSDASAKPAAPSEQPFLQRVEVRAVPIKLDYKPKKVDYAGLRSRPHKGIHELLHSRRRGHGPQHTVIYGCSGFDRLHQSLEDVWMPDIKKNQLPSVLSGLNGVRTLVNVTSGVRDLVVVPIQEYRKDGRIVRSISKGALAFARTTGGELTRFGAKLAIGAQTALQGAEDYLAGHVRRNTRPSKPRRCMGGHGRLRRRGAQGDKPLRAPTLPASCKACAARHGASSVTCSSRGTSLSQFRARSRLAGTRKTRPERS